MSDYLVAIINLVTWIIVCFCLVIIIYIAFVKIVAFHTLKFNSVKQQLGELINNKYFLTSDMYKLNFYGALTKQSKTVLVLVHDFLATGAWFKNLQDNIISDDIDVVSYDQRWVGKNEPSIKMNLGANTSDLDEIISFITNKYPDKKIVLLGEGYGADLVTYCAKKYDNIKKIILSGIIFKSAYKLTNRIKYNIFSGTIMNSNLTINKLEIPTDVVTDKTFAAEMNAHYKKSSIYTVRMFYQLKHLHNMINKKPFKFLKRTNILILQADNDIYFDNSKLVSFVSKIKETSNIKHYPKLKHYLFNELDNQQVFEDIKFFLVKN